MLAGVRTSLGRRCGQRWCRVRITVGKVALIVGAEILGATGRAHACFGAGAVLKAKCMPQFVTR